jgi:hypothetical protein
MKNEYTIVVGKRKRKRSLGRHRGRWWYMKVNIKLVGYKGVDIISSAQNMVPYRVTTGVLISP